MSWALLNLVVAITILPVALMIGDRDARLAIPVLAASVVMTVAILYDKPEAANAPTASLIAMDILVSAALLFLALTTNRFWPLCLPAFPLSALSSYYLGRILFGNLHYGFSVYRGLATLSTLVLILVAALFANAEKLRRVEANTEG